MKYGAEQAPPLRHCLPHEHMRRTRLPWRRSRTGTPRSSNSFDASAPYAMLTSCATSTKGKHKNRVRRCFGLEKLQSPQTRTTAATWWAPLPPPPQMSKLYIHIIKYLLTKDFLTIFMRIFIDQRFSYYSYALICVLQKKEIALNSCWCWVALVQDSSSIARPTRPRRRWLRWAYLRSASSLSRRAWQWLAYQVRIVRLID